MDDIQKIFKVFFIISYKANLEDKIHIFPHNKEGITNFNNIYTKKMDKRDIIISAYSFEVILKDLKEKEKDKETKKIKIFIDFEYNKNIFKGLILFKETKNNFIYNFKIEEKDDKNDNSRIILNLTEFEQLKIYNEILKILKVKQGEPLSLDLIMDSQKFFVGKNSKIYFDFYLEVLKQCYSKKEIKTLLMIFKLDKVILPENLIVKDYATILNLIEKNPNLITKYCSEKDNKNKYLKIFYNLLLFFRINYEKNKVDNLLNQKELWKFYVDILPLNHRYYYSIILPEGLINEILKQKTLSYDIIKGTFTYISSNKDILKSIKNNCDNISEFCENINIKLKISELIIPKKEDNIREIIILILEIVNYELNKNKQFIEFDENFWRSYIGLETNNNPEKKRLILNAIFACQKIDNNLDINKLGFNYFEEVKAIVYPSLLHSKDEIDNNNKHIIEKRLLMPTIGNVSVGKSYFLNSLFGIDFCQVKSDITTKFILFIRHKDELIEPKLYKLTPVKNNDSYNFLKDDEIITGKEKIKNKINDINNDENNDKPIFYMLEIKIKSIQNKEFLNNFDFLDVPGLNESGTDYINIYFNYIKDMIKYCLIIFSTENYNSKDSLEVINKVRKNIYIPMENFLLILNKIDKVNGKIKETIHDFKKILLNNEGINYCNNTIIPVNSLELKSEIQIETDFYHFINYYFIEYSKSKESLLLSFVEYIKNKMKNIESKKKKIIKIELNNLKVDSIKYIKKIVNNFINEMQSKGNTLTIDLEENNEINILKIFYICFEKKLFSPTNSITLNEINNYFNHIKDYSLPKKNDITISEEENFIYENFEDHKLLQKLNDFFKNTFSNSKLRKFGTIIPLLNSDFKILINYIMNSDTIYIPILGISNSGKSSFLNCLIQKDILTCDSSECTRRGIIIKYTKEKDKISLYSIKFNSYENLNYQYYYYKKYKLLSQNITKIKEIINLANESYPKNEEDSFFLLEINIQFLDNTDIKPEIKNKICFIDFPGHNTNNNLFFDKNIYQNVLKMSSFFIYLNNGKAFKEDANKLLLSKLFKEVINIRIGDISPEDFIDLCIFIFNKVDTLQKEEKNLNGIEKDIKEILAIPENFNGQISTSFFSSLLFKKYNEKKFEYKTKNIIDLFYSKFKSLYNEIEEEDELFDDNKETNFLEYLKKNLKKKLESDYSQSQIIKENDNNYDSKLYKELENYMNKIDKEKIIIKDDNYEKNLKTISNILSYTQENLKQLKFYEESYAENTFKNIIKKINKAYKLKNNEYNNHLERFFYFMNIFFRIENTLENINAKNDFEKISKDSINKIENIFKNFKGEEIINKYKDNLLSYISQKKKDYKILLQENGGNINKVINLINDKINNQISTFKEEISSELLDLENKITIEMKNLGISETSLVNKEINYQRSLGKKILLGFHICTLGLSTLAFGIGYGLLYALPNFLINKINDKRKFGQFIDEKKETVLYIMKSYSVSIKQNVKKFKTLSLENAKRLIGLLEANRIETDDFWKDARKEYINIYNEFKNIKENCEKKE